MPVSRDILGLNARNFLFIRRYNSSTAKRIADNKLSTKRLLIKNGISTPDLLHVFSKRSDIRNFDWQFPEKGFVIKPARGYGGAGILAIKNWESDLGKAITGEYYRKEQLESYILDILEGAYSLRFLPDQVFVEERVIRHPFFRKIAPLGIPDIRIIVFNHIPVMAMLRLPTEESAGKANLHLGAVGIGIDLFSGITTQAVHKDTLIRFVPNTKVKVGGIKIPEWDNILLLAATTQSVSGLGYAGVDVVFDAKKGPMVLEVNARPGLSIQNANLTSLRTRLERIENMPIPLPKRGVELAKHLFAEPFSEKITNIAPVLSVIEPVNLENDGNTISVEAKLDTGAYRTSLDRKLVYSLGLPVIKRRLLIRAASGEQLRPAVKIVFELGGRRIKTIATVASRSHLKYPMIVGRKNLKGFLINPEMPVEQEKALHEKDQEKL